VINLTRLDGRQFLLNCDLISHVEIGADTVIFLSDGESFVVKETAAEIVTLVVQFKRRLYAVELPKL
jgi:flagellar protein FlbD